jgi:RimJ/RimL family protein N-acetyltransferase
MQGAHESELHLRMFLPTDDDEVASWFPDAGAVRYFAGKRLTWPIDEAQWDGILMDPDITAWTAVIGDDPKPVGHGELVEESPFVVRLERIVISPEQRGHGFGRELISLLTEKARDGGYTRVAVFTHPDNTTAIRGYRSLGFEPVCAEPGNTAMRMELPLTE